MPVSAGNQWIGSTIVGRILGVDSQSVHRICVAGGVTMRVFPGVRKKYYLRTDVERVAAESLLNTNGSSTD
jgi:hypothetical protein